VLGCCRCCGYNARAKPAQRKRSRDEGGQKSSQDELVTKMREEFERDSSGNPIIY